MTNSDKMAVNIYLTIVSIILILLVMIWLTLEASEKFKTVILTPSPKSIEGVAVSDSLCASSNCAVKVDVNGVEHRWVGFRPVFKGERLIQTCHKHPIDPELACTYKLVTENEK